jgi:hypothetical protein
MRQHRPAAARLERKLEASVPADVSRLASIARLKASGSISLAEGEPFARAYDSYSRS